MYTIHKTNGYLQVTFIDNFDFPMFMTAIEHETNLKEYANINDLWLIGSNHAHISLGEIELMVKEFQCRCPRNAKRTKTAVVVDEGPTSAIIALWVRALRKRVAFEIETFRSLQEAEIWLGTPEACVA